MTPDFLDELEDELDLLVAAVATIRIRLLQLRKRLRDEAEK